MKHRGVEQQPSETALFTALRRTLAYIQFGDGKLGPDNLARYFLPPHFRFFLKFKGIRENTRNKLVAFFPGLNEYVIARTIHFDRLFVEALNNVTPQIVLLGAGYDSRAYRFSDLNHGSRIFELDIAPTQNRKRKCLKSAHIDIPAPVQFVPVDFNLEPLSGVLEKAGCLSDQKTLFIWEGVSYYLDRKSVEDTLGLVSRFAGGSLIAFDYAVSVTPENQGDYHGTQEFARSMGEHHANEGFTFSLREEEIASFLQHSGLKLVGHMNAEEIERTYLLDDNGSPIGRITGHFRFASASPL